MIRKASLDLFPATWIHSIGPVSVSYVVLANSSFGTIGFKPQQMNGNADGYRGEEQGEPKRTADKPDAKPDRCPEDRDRGDLLSERDALARFVIADVFAKHLVCHQPFMKPLGAMRVAIRRHQQKDRRRHQRQKHAHHTEPNANRAEKDQNCLANVHNQGSNNSLIAPAAPCPAGFRSEFNVGRSVLGSSLLTARAY